MRRPYDRFAAPGLALVGDAACHVFPAHASGVGAGLVAARALADAARGGDDPGDARSMAAYQAAFQRDRGAVHAAYDLMRRASQRLSGADLDALLEAGVVQRGATEAALDQRMHQPGPAEAGALALAVLRAPRAARGLAWSALRMPAVARAYASYPEDPDPRAALAWARRAAWVAGHEADSTRTA